VPFVSSTSTRDIYIYYGNDTVPLANQENPTAVWDSNYKGVWSLGHDGVATTTMPDFRDSTSNANDGSSQNMNSADLLDGQVDGALDFDGVNDYVDAGSASSLDNLEIVTYSAWIYARSYSGTNQGHIFGKGGTDWYSSFRFNSSSGTLVFYWIYSTTNLSTVTTTTIPLNTWTYVVTTYNVGGDRKARIYINGVEASYGAQQASVGTRADNSSGNQIIGNDDNVSFSRFFNGLIDNARISNVARSEDWIATEYNNQSSPNSFYSYSGEGVEIRASTVAGVKVRGGPSSASSWYDSGWAYRKKITINPAKVSDGHSNFPMLFSRTDVDLKATASGGHVASTTGGDILFTDENNNKLDHEIELYVSTTGELIAWVEVPFVSSTSTREIYIYYGNDTVPLANQQNATGVWVSDYKGVWHLSQGYSTASNFYTESTSNASHGTLTDPDGNSTAITGQVDGAFNFDGDSADKINIGNISTLKPTAALTLSAWVNPDNFADAWGGAGFIATNGLDCCQTEYAGYGLHLITNQQPRAFIWNGSLQRAVSSDTNMSTGAWHYVVMTFTGTSIIIYQDGQQTKTSTFTSTTINYNNRFFVIGEHSTWGGKPFHGGIDEVRVSAIARSADWIATEYNNQSSPNTFYSYSGEGVQNQSAGTPTVKVRGGVKFR